MPHNLSDVVAELTSTNPIVHRPRLEPAHKTLTSPPMTAQTQISSSFDIPDTHKSQAGESPTASATASSRKAEPWVETECILYKFAPEIRRDIFLAVLDLFFEENPHCKQLIYEATELEVPRSLRKDRRNRKETYFGGLLAENLPELESALFPDTRLHDEFITVRLSLSMMTLSPDAFVAGSRGRWPSFRFVNPLVAQNFGEIAYNMSCASGPGGTANLFLDKRWMKALALSLNHQFANKDDERPHSSLRPTGQISRLPKHMLSVEQCHRPRLEKLIIRLPSHRALTVPSFMYLEPDRMLLWKGLKQYIKATKLETLELQENRRSWLRIAIVHGPSSLREIYRAHDEGTNITSSPGPHFGKFTTDLNKIFGINCMDQKVELKDISEWVLRQGDTFFHLIESRVQVIETWHSPTGLVSHSDEEEGLGLRPGLDRH